MSILRENRTLLTLLLAGALALAVGIVRGGGQENEDIDAFQAMRITWGAEFDMVLARDSRINQGVSPAEMGKLLPGYSIANFGFGHAVFSGEYLEAVENLLDPESERRVIVLGIVPLSLTTLHVDNNEFLQHKRKHPVETVGSVVFRDFLYFFRPIEFEQQQVLRVVGRLDRVKEYHEDGWAAATMNPEKPTIALGFARNNYKKVKVSAEIVDELLAAVSRWRGEGIEVYGFLMPTSLAMVELEAELSGYNDSAFGEAFERAGGTWLEFKMDKYHSYDGQHLRKDSALRFSRVLGRTLKRTMGVR